MKHFRNGLLFGLGLLPFVIFSVWLFHTWPLFGPDVTAAEEFMFDKSHIHVGDAKISRTETGVRVLGEVINRSDQDCSFLHLDCDLRHDGKVIAHEVTIVSALAGRSSRGFTVIFSDVPDTVDLSKLHVQTSVAQALNLDEGDSEEKEAK